MLCTSIQSFQCFAIKKYAIVNNFVHVRFLYCERYVRGWRGRGKYPQWSRLGKYCQTDAKRISTPEDFPGSRVLTRIEALQEESQATFPELFDYDVLFSSSENSLPWSIFCKPSTCWYLYNSGTLEMLGTHFTGRSSVYFTFQISAHPPQSLRRTWLLSYGQHFLILLLHLVQDLFVHQPGHSPPAQAGQGSFILGSRPC